MAPREKADQADSDSPTSPETLHAKRIAEYDEEDRETTPPVELRYRIPTSDRDFFAQVVGYMNRSDRRFAAGNRRMRAIETDVKALRREVFTYVKGSGRITNGCLMIIAGTLLLFLMMRVLGPLDLSEWRGLRAVVSFFGGTAVAEAPAVEAP